MKPFRFGCIACFVIAALLFALPSESVAQSQTRSHAVFQPLELGESQWTAGFWAERQKVVELASVPQMWQIMVDDVKSQFLTNFLVASGEREGKHRGPAWNDGDFYKWIEAASSVYAFNKEPTLLNRLDQSIAAIAKAQRDDGYIHTPVQIRRRHGDESAVPFSEPLQFELYNFGHLMSAGVVHSRATGKKSLLNIAVLAADFLDRTFHGPDSPLGRSAICPAHYMGLIDLGRYVGEPRYIRLAKELIEKRDQVVDGSDDNQDRIPFQKQKEAVGHAVRANYLYAGVADLVSETGDQALLDTLKTIWDDVNRSKLYVTGACGSLFDGASPDGSSSQKSITKTHQAYGRPYQLPNSTAHNESCATIGNILWNWRMLEITGDAKYGDVLELAMYNGLLATVSMDGSSYFYTNTLRQLDKMPTELRWSRERKPFISCYCCPPNILRTIAQSQIYAYGKSKNELWVHLYGSNRVQTKDENGDPIELVQETEYPANGRVHMRFTQAPTSVYSLKLRIPKWAKHA
ncbi:MAG: beta-L-arabinofuranosidase domain-containing protein, partial [Pirellula sp.]